MYGMKFMGSFDELTRKDLIEYFAQQSFEPAKRNGVPIPGIAKMTFK
jgi:hypothetical protein